MKIKKYYFLIILFVAVAIRCINLTQPLLEGASTRQTENAMIARNFYQDKDSKLDIFYPYLVDRGGKKAYQLVEFPLIPFLGALMYFLLGGVYEFALRATSIFFFICAVIMLNKLAKFFFNEEVALYSVFVFSFSPLNIYLSRAFQYEMAMIFFIMSAIYYYAHWIQSKSAYKLILSAFCFAIAVLLKIPNLYLIPILFYLIFKEFKRKAYFKLQFYLFFGFVFILAFLWYRHAYNVMTTYPNPYSVYYTEGFDYIIRNIKYYLTHKMFYKTNFDNLITYTLTPIGFALGIFGLLLDVDGHKLRNVFYVWLLSVMAFFMLTPAQSMQGYYQIHLLPIFAIMIGKCITVLRRSGFLFDKGMLFNKKINFVALFAAIFFIVLRYSYAYFHVPENFRHVVETGKTIEQLTEKNALVIASIENGPDLVYYCNRRGWPFMVHLEEKKKYDIANGEDITGRIYDPIFYLENLRDSGAKYFASASLEEFLSNKRFSKYMFEHYRVIKQTPHFIIFDVKEKIK